MKQIKKNWENNFEFEGTLASFKYSNERLLPTCPIEDFELLSQEMKELLIGWANLLLAKIERLKNHDGKIIFDVDGTLSAFKYDINKLLPCRDDQVNDYSKDHNFYEKARALRCMVYILKHLPKEKVYILTRTEPNLIDKKNDFINANFDVFADHIIHVYDAKNKLGVLEKLHLEDGKKVIFIEDTFKTILDAEEKFDFVIGIHISEFLF